MRFFIILLLFANNLLAFDKVVIWGHKLHSHTHSYVHAGFYQAFSEMGYKTYWLDNSDDLTQMDFSNSLFLTEGQVDQNIPLLEGCIYLLHNADGRKYEGLNFIHFQVYTDDVLTRPGLRKMSPCIYYDVSGKCLYMPWATDLLPKEIEANKLKISSTPKQDVVNWIGTIGEGRFGNLSEINPFIKACEEQGIAFKSVSGVSLMEHQKLILESYMAPTIVGEWQKEVGYIPCRIFKNISYGQMGVTNSERVYELFEGKIVYNPDTYLLFYDAQKKLESMTLDELYALMDFVKDNHTYLNRVETFFDFLVTIGFLD